MPSAFAFPQIDHQIEPGLVLGRVVGRLGAFQDFVHIGRCITRFAKCHPLG